MRNFPLFPDRASTVAGQVDTLYFVLIALSLFFTLLISVLIAYFAVKYRRRPGRTRAHQFPTDLRLELAWILIPLGLALGVFVWGASLYAHLFRAPEGALEIGVIARQWMWEFRHPGGRRELAELHVPVGRPVTLRMISEDVIHSFYVPAFRVKHDVLPDRYTTVWFEATKAGEYRTFCAEFCGTLHSGMLARVIALSPADYETWLSIGAVEPSLVASGERLFRAFGCAGCHSPNSTVRAPLLEGLFGRPVPLADGRTVTADERYIRDAILLPNREVAAGYEPVMPTYRGQITEPEILQLIAYIKALARPRRP